MTEFISELVYNIFKNNAWLGVIVLAVLPITELKGAIPFALSAEIWGGNAFNIYQAFLFSYIGSIIPAFFILLLLRPVFNWMKKFKFTRKIAVFFEERFKKLGQRIKEKAKKEQLAEQYPEGLPDEGLEASSLSENSTVTPSFGGHSAEEHALLAEARKKKSDRIKFWGILVFVAIPLPLTGVWTGSAISVFLNMKFRCALPAILIGNFIAGIFISLVCMIFKSYLIVFYIILGIFFLFALVGLVVSLIKKHQRKVK